MSASRQNPGVFTTPAAAELPDRSPAQPLHMSIRRPLKRLLSSSPLRNRWFGSNLGGSRLPSITYYRVPDPTCSFRIVADEYIRHLVGSDVRVAVRDLDFSPSTLRQPYPATPLAIVHPLFQFTNWHDLDFEDVVEALKKRHGVLLGMEVADSTRISPRFVRWSNHPAVAGIMLPSRFSCEVFRNSGVVTPISCVPHGVMSVKPSSRFNYLRSLDRPVILFFATHSPERKGWDLVHQLIPDFPSCLFVIKAIDAGAHYFCHCPHTLIIREWLSPADLASLYVNSDLLVSLHRGGSFEMHCAEALGYGLPVVATRDGAVLDYLNDTNAWLVNVARHEQLYPTPPWPEGTDVCGLGATADLADARSKLRDVLAKGEEAKRRARDAIGTMRTDWTWRRATQKLVEFARESVLR